MELCTSTRCLPKRLPNLKSFTPYRTNLQWNFSLPLKPNSFAPNNPGLRYYNYTSIKAALPDETSSGANQYVKEEPDVVNYSSVEATASEESSNGANQYDKEDSNGVVTDDEVQSVEENSVFGGFNLFKDDDDDAADDQFPQFDFLNKFSMEFDFEDTFSIALLGVGGVTALWLTASIVGAIDNIPLFPKLMEVVGLGYTIWFSTRYLLFKKSRDELGSKIEEIKQQVFGHKN